MLVAFLICHITILHQRYKLIAEIIIPITFRPHSPFVLTNVVV